MARGQPSTSARPNCTPDETGADLLQAAVEQLSQNVRVLTDIVDELREDLSWLTRNGMPHQPVTVIVQRMPGLAEERSTGSYEFSFARLPDRDPTADTLSDDRVRAAVVEDVVQRLAEPLGELAQEQLNSLVSIIDHAHRQVLQAIQKPPTAQPEEPAPKKSRRQQPKQKSTASVVPVPPAEPPPPRGQLF